MDTPHLPPGFWDAVKAAPFYLALAVLLWKGLGVIRMLTTAAKSTSLRSEREARTDDLVHGAGRTREAPKEDDPGLVGRIEQMENVGTALGGAQRTQREDLDELRAIVLDALDLPDLSDPAAVARAILEQREEAARRHLEELPTGQFEALTEHRATVRAERAQDPPAPRQRPNGRWRGGGGPAE